MVFALEMPSHLRFDDEDFDNFEPSDSEGEYTEKEKKLLNKVRNRKKKYSDSEDEIFGVGPDNDGDDMDDDDDMDEDNSDLAASDVEGQDDDDDIPDIRAWGKDKRKYYSTDYVDPDYGGFQGKDAQLAELEEEEARKLQKQLAQQLDDDDFAFEFVTKDTEEDKKQTEEVIKTDISKLTKRQKLELLKKESPEFFGLVEDFEAKMVLAKDYLRPIIEKYKNGQISNCKAVEFVQTQYTLILNYNTNIYMYLLLKSSRVNVQNHPIIKRLYQYRQLLSQLDPIFEEVIKPQIDLILEKETGNGDTQEDSINKKKKLKLLSSLTTKADEPSKNGKYVKIAEDEHPRKKMRLVENLTSLDNEVDINVVNAVTDSSSDDEQEEEQNSEKQQTEKLNEVGKRAITYEMAKNKGLTPYRKKELRNPRVKHRLKYRKAIIRRKGAVREPRRELTRYSGEISGINASVLKGIKIKT